MHHTKERLSQLKPVNLKEAIMAEKKIKKTGRATVFGMANDQCCMESGWCGEADEMHECFRLPGLRL